ncbi:TetR family transcriptional regulator [Herbihabitans rhizosphaerae]|uniref:TetR family transcriptional regulator n=1 Tax=Herbihabitans rhizosphaerae TaxID=1872711 RepID=A0A4Q7L6B8_9PSEU|nr:TetR/AcrR family transcriptional regulator [Herbihabitans rhizosphaerae]RZS44877.1 TetR family transcriptional regulator [Herbihabitans rhizosphaerae]
MTSGPRQRLIDSAVTLIRERGVHATGVTELLEHSTTARGSIYQHFPGGKAELVEHATRHAGEQVTAKLESITANGTPADWVDALVTWWEKALRASDYGMGCPIAAAALAPSENGGARAAAAEAFAAWREILRAALVGQGVPGPLARSASGFVISALEGAIIQARAMESTRPLRDLRANLTILLTTYCPQ